MTVETAFPGDSRERGDIKYPLINSLKESPLVNQVRVLWELSDDISLICRVGDVDSMLIVKKNYSFGERSEILT